MGEVDSKESIRKGMVRQGLNILIQKLIMEVIMKKVGIFFSMLACLTVSYSFACGAGYNGDMGGEQQQQGYGYNEAGSDIGGGYDNGAMGGNDSYAAQDQGDQGEQGGQACAPADRAIKTNCQTLYCHWKPCYYNKTHCQYVPKYTYKKCCRYVPQSYEKQCCKMVPQYYTQTCTKYVPQYYYTSNCHYVPKYTQERCCKYVPKYYYKNSSQCLNQEVAPQEGASYGGAESNSGCAPCSPCGAR